MAAAAAAAAAECRQRQHWLLAVAVGLVLGACDEGAKATDETLKVGDPYPALSVSDCAGAPVDMRTWIGAYDAVYLSFAAGWCQSCQEEAPRLEAELVVGLAGKNVGVAQILMENAAGSPPTTTLCGAWKTELNVSYDVFADLQQLHLEPIFGGNIANLPVHVIVTRDGVVRYVRIGALPDDIQQIVTDWLP
jgi:hypothetical protein